MSWVAPQKLFLKLLTNAAGCHPGPVLKGNYAIIIMVDLTLSKCSSWQFTVYSLSYRKTPI